MTQAGHAVQGAWNAGDGDAPDFKIVCECQWETWGHVTRSGAANEYATHVADEVTNTAYDAAMAALDRELLP